MRNKKTRRSSRSSPSTPTGTNQGALLIAVELGAAWPELDPSLADDVRRVLSQRDGEAPAAFAERVGSSLDGLFGRGVTLASVTVACNERADSAAQDARRALAGLALGSMAKNQTGQVCFAAPAHSSGCARNALSSLARVLHDEWHTAGLEVTVDFGERATARPAPTFIFTARVA